MVNGALVITAAAVLVCGCHRAASDESSPVVRLVRDTFVGNISEPLAREYARVLPNIHVQLVDSLGSAGTVEAIQRGDADLGFAQADVAYFSYRSLKEPALGPMEPLRSIAALHPTPVHLLLRQRLSIGDIADLRGLRVRTGPASTAQARVAELILRAYGLSLEEVDSKTFASGAIADALAGQSVDAAFTSAYYPAGHVRDAVEQGAQLIPIDGPVVEHLKGEYPFVQSLTIPSGIYPRQSEPLRTIGVQRLLITRSGLDERVVYALTREFFEALPRLGPAVQGTSLRLMDLARAPATPIPLHKGAARYYREQALLQ